METSEPDRRFDPAFQNFVNKELVTGFIALWYYI